MLREQTKDLYTIATFADEFCFLFREVPLCERENEIELFVFQALSMCMSHCRAASILLENKLLGETINILRPIQELYFNLAWIFNHEDRAEQTECVFQLEAAPYFHLNKEANIISKYNPPMGANLKSAVSVAMVDYPYLTTINKKGEIIFKSPPNFATRMIDEELCVKYYHVYCFSSIFVHPSPFTRALYIHPRGDDTNHLQGYIQSAQEFIAYIIIFATLIIVHAELILKKYQENNDRRKAILAKMDELINKYNTYLKPSVD